jgi:hypothetical protein
MPILSPYKVTVTAAAASEPMMLGTVVIEHKLNATWPFAIPQPQHTQLLGLVQVSRSDRYRSL